MTEFVLSVYGSTAMRCTRVSHHPCDCWSNTGRIRSRWKQSGSCDEGDVAIWSVGKVDPW